MSAQLKAVQVVNVATAAAVTTNGESGAVDLLQYDGDVRLVLNSGATNGAGRTLDVKIEHSADGTTWTDSGVAFTQVTNAAASHQIVGVTAEQFKRYIRATDTVAGSSPSVVRSVDLVGRVR